MHVKSVYYKEFYKHIEHHLAVAMRSKVTFNTEIFNNLP